MVLGHHFSMIIGQEATVMRSKEFFLFYPSLFYPSRWKNLFRRTLVHGGLASACGTCHTNKFVGRGTRVKVLCIWRMGSFNDNLSCITNGCDRYFITLQVGLIVHTHLTMGRGEALPYLAYTGTCHRTGYGFWPLCTEQGV